MGKDIVECVGGGYDYEGRGEGDERVDGMNRVVYEDDGVYEERESRGWRNREDRKDSVNGYYKGGVGEWKMELNGEGLWWDRKNGEEMVEELSGGGGWLEKESVRRKNVRENRVYGRKVVLGDGLWGGNVWFGGEERYRKGDNR